MRTVATPGYLEKAAQDGGPGMIAVETLKRSVGKNPSWIVGDPAVKEPTKEDGGRTLKINAPFRFYCIRDEHPKDCDCGCGGVYVITLLLPEEY